MIKLSKYREALAAMIGIILLVCLSLFGEKVAAKGTFVLDNGYYISTEATVIDRTCGKTVLCDTNITASAAVGVRQKYNRFIFDTNIFAGTHSKFGAAIYAGYKPHKDFNILVGFGGHSQQLDFWATYSTPCCFTRKVTQDTPTLHTVSIQNSVDDNNIDRFNTKVKETFSTIKVEYKRFYLQYTYSPGTTANYTAPNVTEGVPTSNTSLITITNPNIVYVENFTGVAAGSEHRSFSTKFKAVSVGMKFEF